MKPKYHVAVSAGLSLGVQAMTHSWQASLGCFLSGVFIDLDHHLDYCLLRKKFPYRYKDLADFSLDRQQSKVYIFFHSYECLIVLWFSIYYFHLSVVWSGVALGLTVHLLCDQLTNPIKPLFYFLTYRIKNQFEKTKVLSEKYFSEER